MIGKNFLRSVLVISSLCWAAFSAPVTAQTTSPAGESPAETITLKIDGWTCRSCEKDIRRSLLAVLGVRAAEVSYARGGAIVTTEAGRVSHDQLVKAVESASSLLSTYHATVVPNGTLPDEAQSGDGIGSWFKKLFE